MVRRFQERPQLTILDVISHEEVPDEVEGYSEEQIPDGQAVLIAALIVAVLVVPALLCGPFQL